MSVSNEVKTNSAKQRTKAAGRRVFVHGSWVAAASLLAASCATRPSADDDRPARETALRDYGPPRLMRQAGFSVQGPDRPVPVLPSTHAFNADNLTAEQADAWLAHMIPRLAFQGAVTDFLTLHNRVIIRDGMFRQYRIFGGGPYPARTYQIRQLPFSAISADGISAVLHAPAYGHSSSGHWYFTVKANSRRPWVREWEVWDSAENRVNGRGTFHAEEVTFRFADPAGAAQARAVWLRRARLRQQP